MNLGTGGRDHLGIRGRDASEFAFFSTPDRKWDEMLALNLLAGMRLSRHYLPAWSNGLGAGSCSSRPSQA